MVVAKFFEATCIAVFKQLLNARSQENSLLGLVSTYFRMVDTNGWGILYLYSFL